MEIGGLNIALRKKADNPHKTAHVIIVHLGFGNAPGFAGCGMDEFYVLARARYHDADMSGGAATAGSACKKDDIAGAGIFQVDLLAV